MNQIFQLIIFTILSTIILLSSPIISNTYAEQNIDPKKKMIKISEIVQNLKPIINTCNLQEMKTYIKNNPDTFMVHNRLANGIIIQSINTCDNKFIKYILDIAPLTLKKTPGVFKDIEYSPLLIAILAKKYDLVKYIIKKGADVNQKVESLPIIYYAITAKNIDSNIVIYLIKKGADTNYVEPNFKTNILMPIVAKGNYKLFKYVIGKNKNIDLTLKDSKGRNLFYYAVDGKNLDIIDYLIDTNIDTTVLSSDKIKIMENINAKTLKHLEEKNIKITLTDDEIKSVWWRNHHDKRSAFLVEYLISKGFDINSKNSDGETALENILSGSFYDYDYAETLFKNGAKFVESNKPNKKPLLFHARDQDNYLLIKLLIDNGVDVNTVYDNNTLLTEEVSFKPNVDLVKYLIDNGADVNATDEWGSPALLASLPQSPLVVVEMLLEAGANVHGISKAEDYPITSSGLSDDPKYAELLLKYGAIIDTQTRDGSTALFYATKNNYIDTVKLLVENGADVNIKTNSCVAPVDYAIWIGNKKMVDYLISNGAVINEEFESLGVIEYMMQIIEDGSVGYVRDLLRNGYDVENRDKHGYTAFLKAVQVGDRYTVKILVGAGSDINAVTNKNETALMLAQKKGHKEVIEYLKEIATQNKFNLL